MARPRLALVEDNPDNRLLLCALLEDAYDVDEYEEGASALSAMAADPPDLVLMDISLPGMDGTEVLLRMKAAPLLSSVPVIAITAHAMIGDRERLLAHGFDAYLTKPIMDVEELYRTVDSLLDRG